METKIEQSILKTVLYADVFDYPLSPDQLWQFLISDNKFTKKDFEKTLSDIKKPIILSNGFYCLLGRESIIEKKIQRKKESEKKFLIAKKAARVISVIPSVLFIGISGGLSMENAEENDDIDIFIITKGNTIWLTRMLTILILKSLGKHRGRLDKKVKDKICLNMFLDEENLSLDRAKRNLYSAHEITQVRPIFSRNNTYEEFLSQNLWVRGFLPNSLPENLQIGKSSNRKKKKQNMNYFLRVIEFIVGKLQARRIKGHLTYETISDGVLAFHPFDYNKVIMSGYNKRLEKYGQKI